MSKAFRYGVTVSMEEVPASWPINLRGGIEEVAEVAARLGYDALELQLRDPDHYDWKHMKEVAAQHGLTFCADATGRELSEHGLNLISDDPGVRRAAIDKLKLHADMCKELGCLLIEGSMRSNLPQDKEPAIYWGYLDEATIELTDYAASIGVNVIIENIKTSISNYLNTMRQVADYVRKFDRPNLGIHLDTFSMIDEENDIAGAYEYCGDKLMYVHFADTNRFFTGGGNVDFKAHMYAMKKMGYEGVITVETRPYPDQLTSAENCIRYMRALETIVDIERSNLR